MNIQLFQDDITKIKADAIVNADNTSLLGGVANGSGVARNACRRDSMDLYKE